MNSELIAKIIASSIIVSFIGLFIWGVISTLIEESKIKMPTEKKYNDKVKITGGFYKGQKGWVIGEYRCIGNSGFCNEYGHKVKLENNEEVLINQQDMDLDNET